MFMFRAAEDSQFCRDDRQSFEKKGSWIEPTSWKKHGELKTEWEGVRDQKNKIFGLW